jgi:hypothetical protein
MARFSNDIQQHEVRAYEQFCVEHDIVLDGSESAIANANLTRDYFTKTWHEVITPETLEKALPQLRSQLKFKSKAQLEFEKLARQEPERAGQLDSWLQTQGGKPGQLVNSLYSDETYENLTLLLTTLRGYEITPPRIRDAENRVQSKPGRKLHYVEAPRRTDPVSRLAREDAEYSIGKPFSDSDLVKTADGSLRSKTPAEQRRDMEAAERAKSSQAQTQVLDPSEQSWKSMADDSLNVSGPHSLRDRVRQIYDREQGQGSWRRVYEAVQREINIYKSKGIR